jgi:hypothetical protein
MSVEIVACPQPGCDGIADGEVEYVYDAGGNVVGRLVKRILRCRTCEYADGAAAHGDYGGAVMYSHRLSHAYRATH